MILANDALRPEILTLVASDAALSDANKTLLAAELTNDPQGMGYAGKAAHEVIPLLCAPYTVPNPTPQTSVLKTGTDADMDPTYLRNFLMNKVWDGASLWFMLGMIAKKLVDAPTQVLALAFSVTNLLGQGGENSAVPSVSLENPGILAALNGMVAAGMLSQDDVDSLTKWPDPTYQSTLLQPARTEAIGIGANVCLLPRDLDGLV